MPVSVVGVDLSKSVFQLSLAEFGISASVGVRGIGK